MHLHRRWQGRQPLDERVVHQRLPNLQRVRHARAVDLGVDVADEIGLEIQILNQRKRVVGSDLACMAVEHLDGVVAAQAEP